MKKLIIFLTLSFIMIVLFAQPSFSESLELKENEKVILQKKQPEQKQQSKIIKAPEGKASQTPKQDTQTKKQIHQRKNPVKLYPDSSVQKDEAEQIPMEQLPKEYQNSSPPIRERQDSTQQVRPESTQFEQLQDKVEPWEETTPDWSKETYDLEVGPPLENTPAGHPETDQTPGTWTEQNVEQHPGSMPQINTDLEMEQDNSNMTGYIQPDFAVKEVYYENGELKIVIMNLGRRINPPDCPQLAVDFGINGIDNTEHRTYSQCMDRERVINTNLAIDWQETDGKKICWVKLDPDNAIQELDKSNNNYEAPIYRTQEPDVHMIGNHVEIAKSGKTFSHGDAVSLEREDVSDRIEDYRTFTLNLKYDLINYGAQAISFNANFYPGWVGVYPLGQTNQYIRLEPGERKTIIHSIGFHASHCLSPLSLSLDSPQGRLFSLNAEIQCSTSVLNWFGGKRPDVRIPIPSTNSLPYLARVHFNIAASFITTNKGGNLNDYEKWDLSFEIIKNSTGEVVFHREWPNLTTPHKNNRFTKNMNFVPTETGSYTYRIRGSSRAGIFDSNCFGRNNEITREKSFNVDE